MARPDARPPTVILLLCASILLLSPAGPTSGGVRAAGAEPGWFGAVQADLVEREYHVTWQDDPVLADQAPAWHAPNRAHGFRTYFGETGIRVVPRVEAVPSWEWGLAWIGYGRGGTSYAVAGAAVVAEENRVAYRRGALDESYENSSRGLKRGFVLPFTPEELAIGGAPLSTLPLRTGEGSDLVHVDLALVGNLTPKIAEDGQGVDFVTAAGGRALRYGELRVTDARNDEVRAWLEGFSDDGVRGIRLVLDASGAIWPLTIDTLATSAVWMAESDQSGADFGCSVATAGDVNGDGYSDVIIGASQFDNGQSNEGRAFVYHGSPAGPSMSPAWSAESDQASASFGHSVATAGDVNSDGYADVIVGADTYDNGENNEGRVFVYHGSALGLAATPSWTAEGERAATRFGSAVATAGDVDADGYADVIVGAERYDNGQTNEGLVSVYHGSAGGLSPAPTWTIESDEGSAFLGSAVATAGDVDGDGYADVIVGAEGYDVSGNEGRALVYHGSPSGLAASPSWSVVGDQVLANLGHTVATAGDVNGDGYADVIVGAPGYSHGQSDEGRALVYHGSATGLATSPAWVTEGNQVEAYFGFSVATAGDVNGDGYADVIVGATEYDNDQSNEGRAFVYCGSPSGLGASPAWTVESNQTGSLFGHSVAPAGDVDGDGFADVIVGANEFDNDQSREGGAFVYRGSSAGLATAAGWQAEIDQAAASLGIAVATAGDVNGDGYADVIVGAKGYDNGQNNEGLALVYHGSEAGLEASPAWTAESDDAGDRFGYAVATAGDVNGDGYADVIVGAHLHFAAGQVGLANVYHGSPMGLSASPSWSREGGSSSAFGFSVGTAGDVNGDGYSDVIIGAPYYGSLYDGGRAYVYRGSAGGVSSLLWTEEVFQDWAWYGYSVATAGDFNGDGYSDFIVGASRYDGTQVDEGRAFLYKGSATGTVGNPIILVAPPPWQANAAFGASVGTAGDVNGDGYADILVGAYLYDNGETDEGRVFLYHGAPTGNPSVAWSAEGDQAGAEFGSAVATAGDVNGDGYADVIVGASLHDNGQVDEGRASVYFGNEGPALSLDPRQRRTDDEAPIAHLGTSDADGFNLHLLGRTPFGRGRVRLESEVKPLGAAFDGLNTIFGDAAYHDTGLSGIELSVPVTGLDDATPYHWRIRLLYDTVTTPFAPHSRWITIPWKGWQETMLRTSPPGAGRLSGGSPGGPLRVLEASGEMITLSWDASCLLTDTSYAVYQGLLGDFASHESLFCSLPVQTITFSPPAADMYYLVVPRNASREGSYGTNSDGAERPQGIDACVPQRIAECP